MKNKKNINYIRCGTKTHLALIIAVTILAVSMLLLFVIPNTDYRLVGIVLFGPVTILLICAIINDCSKIIYDKDNGLIIEKGIFSHKKKIEDISRVYLEWMTRDYCIIFKDGKRVFIGYEVKGALSFIRQFWTQDIEEIFFQKRYLKTYTSYANYSKYRYEPKAENENNQSLVTETKVFNEEKMTNQSNRKSVCRMGFLLQSIFIVGIMINICLFILSWMYGDTVFAITMSIFYLFIIILCMVGLFTSLIRFSITDKHTIIRRGVFKSQEFPIEEIEKVCKNVEGIYPQYVIKFKFRQLWIISANKKSQQFIDYLNKIRCDNTNL